MKRTIATVAFLCVFAGACVPAAAQVTITAGDVSAQLAVGQSIITLTDTLTTSANIGSRGLTSWDFSGLLNHTSATMTSVTPSSSPFIAQFPGATHVLKSSLVLPFSFSGLTGVAAGEVYTYLMLGGASLVNAGGMGSGTVTLTGGSPLAAQLSMLNAPPDTTYGLPMSFGTGWGSTFTSRDSVSVTLLGGFLLSSKNHTASFVVDAYGPLKMPGGSIHDALRVRKEDRSSNPIISYMFMAKDGATVQLTASDPSLPDSGTISVFPKTVQWTAGPPTSVPLTEAVPTEFALLQNYPNPFNPVSTIGFSIAEPRFVTLRVFDILGREVAVLVNETKAPGRYEVSFDASRLASGVYFYRLVAGQFVEYRKMVLMK